LSDKPKEQLRSSYTPHKGQCEFHNCDARFRILITGVRWGKSEAGAAELVKAACEESGHYWAVAPTYRMLWISWQKVIRLLEEHPGLIKRREKRNKRIWLKNGSIIEGRSAEWPDTLRGPGLLGIWVDEASYIKREAARIIRTRVSDTLGRIWITTTPRGKNWVYEWNLKGIDEKIDNYAAFRFPSSSSPYFPKSEWAEAKKDLPADFFRQEYEAEFLDRAAGVFRNVDDVVRADGESFEAVGPFYIGADWAKKYDYTVLIVMDSKGQVVDLLRMQELSFEEQKRRAIGLVEKWQATLFHDSTGLGDPIHDGLVETLDVDRVVGFSMQSRSKGQLIQVLQSEMESGSISIPPDPDLVDELKWFEYEMTARGTMKYKAPEGYHDDCVYALALANWGRVRHGGGGSAIIVDIEPERYGTVGREPLLGMENEGRVIHGVFGAGRKRFLGSW